MNTCISIVVALILTGSVAVAQQAGSGVPNSSTASPTAENPNGGAATTGTNPSGAPSVTAPSTRSRMTNPDGTRSPTNTAPDSQLGVGTTSGDMNGTSQSSADRPK
jgi:hypothetical protein